MITPALLDILRCLESHSRLILASPTQMETMNELLVAGRLKNRVGDTLKEPLAAALVNDTETLAYPIMDGIPVMLLDEAIPLNQLNQEELDGP